MPAPSLLYVTQVAPYVDGPAGVHGVLDQSATAFAELAESAGLTFHRVPDVRSLDADLLAEATVVALFTIGETPWSPVQRATFVEGVRTGRTSVMAIHSATDSCHGWDDYGLLVGGRFAGHPWTCSFTVDVLEPTHPAVAHFGPTLTWHDEVYLFRDLRPDARILLAARPDQFGPGEHPAEIALSTEVERRAIPSRGASPRGTVGSSRPRSATSPMRGRTPATCDTSPGGWTGQPPAPARTELIGRVNSGASGRIGVHHDVRPDAY